MVVKLILRSRLEMKGVVGGVCNHPLEVGGQCCVAGEIQTHQARRAEPQRAAGQGREPRAEASASDPAPGCSGAGRTLFRATFSSYMQDLGSRAERPGSVSHECGRNEVGGPRGGGHSPGLGSRGIGRRCRPPGPAPVPGRPRTWSGRRRRAGAARAARAAGRRAGGPRAGRPNLRCPSPPSRAGTWCSLGWRGAWRSARWLRRSPPSSAPSLAPPPATDSEDGAEPARGQAGLDVRRSEPGAARGARGRAGRAPGYPNSYKPRARAGLGSQSAPGEAASSTPTSGPSSFLSPPSLSYSH